MSGSALEGFTIEHGNGIPRVTGIFGRRRPRAFGLWRRWGQRFGVGGVAGEVLFTDIKRHGPPRLSDSGMLLLNLKRSDFLFPPVADLVSIARRKIMMAAQSSLMSDPAWPTMGTRGNTARKRRLAAIQIIECISKQPRNYIFIEILESSEVGGQDAAGIIMLPHWEHGRTAEA
jgi:hypothetical protein